MEGGYAHTPMVPVPYRDRFSVVGDENDHTMPKERQLFYDTSIINKDTVGGFD